ncbi:hypothetical protein CRENBAI_002442 [Crenichthys baileyi]|uniref:Uncharacterized protein n=1 Tax=Crenichthys baileyi TaxID=28760 RepID=A0AAV9QXK5_9TELE
MDRISMHSCEEEKCALLTPGQRSVSSVKEQISLCILFMIEKNRQIRVLSAVMWVFHQSPAEEKELDHLRFNPPLSSQDVLKIMRSQIQPAEISLLDTATRLSLSDGVRNSIYWGAQRRTAAPLHWSDIVVRASVQVSSWLSSFGGFMGRSHWKKIVPVGLDLPTWALKGRPRTLWKGYKALLAWGNLVFPQNDLRTCQWRDGCLGFPAISGRQMTDQWLDILGWA